MQTFQTQGITATKRALAKFLAFLLNNCLIKKVNLIFNRVIKRNAIAPFVRHFKPTFSWQIASLC